MKRIRIDVEIKSLDSNNLFVTDGELKNDRIKFIDNENNTNFIVFHDKTIEYYKKGNIDMKFKFNQEEITKGEYKSQGYEFVFDIKTKDIIRKKDYLHIKYDLYQDKDIVNKTEIVLKYTFL